MEPFTFAVSATTKVQHITAKTAAANRSATSTYPMIEDGLCFSLVPWRDALEPQIGRHISCVVTRGGGGGVDWSFVRKLRLGL
ncbi:DUF3363 domain-containing protein [Bradyrhizobium sp. BR13661]|uniref:DUF3363 domain-containing protein n=1 Tax=Bradyrhizobium sp. BR13661 TaxID=2940622 RepID=UPI0024763AE5|nr:DUF3363 domain-containing protein [Bradyrhizobium sp. BR13661]